MNDSILAAAALDRWGYWLAEGLLESAEIEVLDRELSRFANTYGQRDILLLCPDLPAYLKSFLALSDVIRSLTPSPLTCVKHVYFNKLATSNWPVYRHQDIVISVSQRSPSAKGYSGWRAKDGRTSCVAPTGVLEQMLTVRIHLDDSDADNGALSVWPGTHQLGVLAPNDVLRQTQDVPAIPIYAKRGSVLFMRPLLIHTSNRSHSERPRRVLHLEFGKEQLPEQVSWSTAIRF